MQEPLIVAGVGDMNVKVKTSYSINLVYQSKRPVGR